MQNAREVRLETRVGTQCLNGQAFVLIIRRRRGLLHEGFIRVQISFGDAKHPTVKAAISQGKSILVSGKNERMTETVDSSLNNTLVWPVSNLTNADFH